MNELSWILYFADFLDSLKAAAICGLFLFPGFAFCELIAKTGDLEIRPGKLWILPIFSIFIAILTPSQNTIYAIAASEMGEKFLESQIATKAEKALDAWLDKQIGDEK
jgi:hypothetical protein